MWPQKWDAVRLWFWLNFKPNRTAYVTAKIRYDAVMVLVKPYLAQKKKKKKYQPYLAPKKKISTSHIWLSNNIKDN